MNAAAGKANEFPWDKVMAMGFGLLRLSPRDFWSMTPREMERAMSVLAGGRAGGLARGDLAEMMQRFPDRLPSGRHDPHP